MPHNVTEQAIVFMKAQRFGEALPLLRRAINEDPLRSNAWYMAGQCCRFLNDIDAAIAYLSRATELKSDEPAFLLALGIALQLRERWDDAINAFRQAIELDPDYDLAYNSLALTQKKRGELTKALDCYDAGTEALARRIVKSMRNDRSSPILKHRETVGNLWVKYAGYGALHLGTIADGIDSIGWPTGEQAEEEERTESRAGLYWLDVPDDENNTIRVFLPNFYNTFREVLRRDFTYSDLIGNRGTVLELLGRHEEARQHFEEATEFLPHE